MAPPTSSVAPWGAWLNPQSLCIILLYSLWAIFLPRCWPAGPLGTDRSTERNHLGLSAHKTDFCSATCAVTVPLSALLPPLPLGDFLALELLGDGWGVLPGWPPKPVKPSPQLLSLDPTGLAFLSSVALIKVDYYCLSTHGSPPTMTMNFRKLSLDDSCVQIYVTNRLHHISFGIANRPLKCNMCKTGLPGCTSDLFCPNVAHLDKWKPSSPAVQAKDSGVTPDYCCFLHNPCPVQQHFPSALHLKYRQNLAISHGLYHHYLVQATSSFCLGYFKRDPCFLALWGL